MLVFACLFVSHPLSAFMELAEDMEGLSTIVIDFVHYCFSSCFTNRVVRRESLGVCT